MTPSPTDNGATLTRDMRDEISKRLSLNFSPDVLKEIQRIKVLHAQKEVEEMQQVYL